MPEQIKRHVAIKLRVADILGANYVKEEGEWSPNYLEINNTQVARVNIIGVLISKETAENYTNIVMDDGTGKISIRSFEDSGNNVGIGDFVLVIGRPREFGNERYIVPEIIKKLSERGWIEVRKLELKDKKELENKVEAVKVEKKDYGKDPTTTIFEFIKEFDSGNGVEIQEIIEKTKLENSENIIKNLLEIGEIFEIKPGRLKVLE